MPPAPSRDCNVHEEGYIQASEASAGYSHVWLGKDNLGRQPQNLSSINSSSQEKTVKAWHDGLPIDQLTGMRQSRLWQSQQDRQPSLTNSYQAWAPQYTYGHLHPASML
jgi:hypothetical protein